MRAQCTGEPCCCCCDGVVGLLFFFFSFLLVKASILEEFIRFLRRGTKDGGCTWAQRSSGAGFSVRQGVRLRDCKIQGIECFTAVQGLQ